MAKWVSCEEKLPPDGMAVIVVNQWGQMYTCRRSVIMAKNSFQRPDYTPENAEFERFTHWHYLPEPPQ